MKALEKLAARFLALPLLALLPLIFAQADPLDLGSREYKVGIG